jgi:hypothetical protein
VSLTSGPSCADDAGMQHESPEPLRSPSPNHVTRRSFLGALSASCVAGMAMSGAEPPRPAPAERRYHVCLSPEALEADPELLDIVRAAGVGEVWLAGFFYGHWPWPIEKLESWRRRIESKGMRASVVDVPLGHPGDSLGAKSGSFPLTPPERWKLASLPDGSRFAGTSLHAPATEENVEAMRRLKGIGVSRVFLDDDFRLARGPGSIGGCFCPEHRRAFLARGGYPESRWEELLEAVRTRSLVPILRDWIEFACDELTASFRAQRDAIAPGTPGIMVMYLGAEKAGIRLEDYRGAPLRVGELMFDDGSFGAVKGKTDELFSSLFHRRFVAPELAFSETTAFPADRLSARNMAAKLAVSTLSDVRNTMMMSGVSPFPRTHWTTLGPAMKRNAEIHRRVAGHVPRGPLKHFWGDASRRVGDDTPYSLFLALGIPFEVTDRPAADGWTFLSDADARDAAGGGLRSPGTRLVGRAAPCADVRAVPENLESLLALKREIAPGLGDLPFVEGEDPVACAWYPTARAAVLWNLSDAPRRLTVRRGELRRTIDLAALDIALVEME